MVTQQPVPPSASAVPGQGAELYAGVALLALLAASLLVGGFEAFGREKDLRPLAAGQEAPPFSLPSATTGEPLALSSLRGRVVLVDFWATWCAPCLRELPELAALHTSLGDRGFTVLGVNREPEDRVKVKAFIAEKELPFPTVVDTDGTGERYRIVSLPMTVLVDRQGRVVRQFMGYTDPSVVRDAVVAALGP